MMKLYSKALYAFIISFSFFSLSHAQLLKEKAVLTYADTLRGSNGPGRDWWDALKYDIHVKFNLDDSTISGKNVMTGRVKGCETVGANNHSGLQPGQHRQVLFIYPNQHIWLIGLIQRYELTYFNLVVTYKTGMWNFF